VGCGKWNVNVGHGSAFPCGTQGREGVFVGAGAELNAVFTLKGREGVFVGAGAELNAISLHHENVQARVGLDVSTGVGFSTTDVSATVVGVGFNAALFGGMLPFANIEPIFRGSETAARTRV
ncbi:unnamed protein product, partial [Didymodactylos carnosus]